MTTKPDIQELMELSQKYKQKAFGILTQSEESLIKTTLEIEARTSIELQNIRDMAVLLYEQLAKNENTAAKSIMRMDTMSAICAVINSEKFKRGDEI